MATVAESSTSITPPTDEPFVTLVENQLAVAATERLIETGVALSDPAGAIRLVYLYGPSGVGKSHLCRYFLWNEAQSPQPGNLLHFTASELVAQVDKAHAVGRLNELRESFLQTEVLVCEDLGGIERKPESQRLLIATIDETLARGGRVLLTGPKSPGEFDRLQARLVNRLHGGASIGIGMPGLASRVQLLTHFARMRQASIPVEAIQYLAESLTVSPRELRAAIAQLDHRAQATGGVVTRAVVEQFLEHTVTRPNPGLPEITSAVARQFGVTVTALRTGGRTAATALPRQVAMSLARELTAHPLERIAGFFGRQNHGTVIHAHKKLAVRLENDPGLRRDVKQIRQRLGLELR